MASHYVHEDNRKHKYVTRACTYPIRRITEPMDDKDRLYKSITKMSEETGISDYQIRQFVQSHKEQAYLRSKTDGVLYLIKRPVKDLAISARLADEDSGAPPYQEFTSLYQLVKRFRISYETVAIIRKSQPIGVESTKTVYDEFKRRYYLTFYK
jgi:predicted transcriptional regulator